MSEQPPLGLAFVPVKGEAGGEIDPLGVLGRGGVDFPLCGQRRHFSLSLALQEVVMRMREAEEKGQAFYYFVFQIKKLLLAT